MFFLKKVLSALILPPLGPLLLVALGLLMLDRWPRLSRILMWSGLLTAVALVTPATVDVLLADLEVDRPVSSEALKDAQAIVILGGGQRRNAPEYGGPTVNRFSLERVRYGAKLARETHLPILVTGGAPTGKVGEAVLMREVLEQEFRVPVRWVEDASLDTRDNARNSAQILHREGIEKVALVTHAVHMKRAQEEFEAAGIQAIPAPTAFLAGPGASDEIMPALPGPTSAWAGWYATHEWLGRLAGRLRQFVNEGSALASSPQVVR